jgi:hypothetical protein
MTSWVRASGPACVALIFSFSLLGCAASNPPASNPPASPAGVTGNWEFTAAPGYPMGAYLNASGSSVTGSAVMQMAFPLDCSPACCGGPFADFNGSLTGTIDSSGNLKLTSAVSNGGPVFTMSGQVANGSLTNGTYTLTGGCPASGAFTGAEYPALNGTYAGTLTSKDTGNSFTISTNLAQTTINSRGFLDVTSSATLSGYPCMSSATGATPLDENSGILGNQFGVGMNGNQSGTTFSLSGSLSQDGRTINASYTVGGGSCTLDYGTGTLTFQ